MRVFTAVIVLSMLTLLMACETASPPLTTAVGAAAAAAKHNTEGIEHFNMGHWDVAKGHFEAAIKADPMLAEPHYNLALALHNLGVHGEATTHFKKAVELGPRNSAITESRAYQHHVAPPPSVGGGYGFGGGY
jgi:Tfp pilus assembly protein PilF